MKTGQRRAPQSGRHRSCRGRARAAVQGGGRRGRAGPIGRRREFGRRRSWARGRDRRRGSQPRNGANGGGGAAVAGDWLVASPADGNAVAATESRATAAAGTAATAGEEEKSVAASEPDTPDARFWSFCPVEMPSCSGARLRFAARSSGMYLFQCGRSILLTVAGEEGNLVCVAADVAADAAAAARAVDGPGAVDGLGALGGAGVLATARGASRRRALPPWAAWPWAGTGGLGGGLPGCRELRAHLGPASEGVHHSERDFVSTTAALSMRLFS